MKALTRLGHDWEFFEQDQPYYRSAMDGPFARDRRVTVFSGEADFTGRAAQALARADVAIVTSYFPLPGVAEKLLHANLLKVFYDLDSPVTLADVRLGKTVPYLTSRLYRAYDLVLSYAGGERFLRSLSEELGARRVAALYGSVDPDVHHRVEPDAGFQAALSYMGTFAADREQGVRRLLIDPAGRKPRETFRIAGAQYPDGPALPGNVILSPHVPPERHSAWYSSARFTLNVTRSAMLESGYCPSARLFEAAACGSAMITDRWRGLSAFFEEGREIFAADSTDDVCRCLDLPADEVSSVAAAAQRRVLRAHTALHRAVELEQMLNAAREDRSSTEGVLCGA